MSPWHRSIKRYFLMDQGDFFVHFMDLTEEELRKPVEDITPTRLEALLELALRMSTANTDPFKDDLKVGAVGTRSEKTAGPSPVQCLCCVSVFHLGSMLLCSCLVGRFCIYSQRMSICSFPCSFLV